MLGPGPGPLEGGRRPRASGLVSPAPTICNPMGRPSPENPQGIVADGWPVMLKGVPRFAKPLHIYRESTF